MSSVLEKWHPVTHDFGLIRGPLESVLSELQGWHCTFGTQYTRTEIRSSLEDALQSLLPLAQSKMRRLFVATHSDWVACFQNGIRGSDPFPAMSYLAQKMDTLAMRVCSTEGDAPATTWEVYAPATLGGIEPLGYRRSISAAKDDSGGWVFHESGERYPFERVERYSARRKQDRFTRDMLRDYTRNFGVELFSDAFLRVDAALPAVRLQQTTNVRAAPEFTREQVVAGVPWQRGSG